MKQVFPVVVTEVKATADPETFQVRLEQTVERDITTQSGLLGFTMGGHEKFGSTKTKRVAFQNFSKAKVEELKLAVGVRINDLPGIEKAKIVVTETTTPRTWYSKSNGELQTQKPKTAGEGGVVLTYQGQPIYRNVALAVNDMDFTDKFIQHDAIPQTTPAASVEEVAEGAMPGQVGEDDLPY